MRFICTIKAEIIGVFERFGLINLTIHWETSVEKVVEDHGAFCDESHKGSGTICSFGCNTYNTGLFKSFWLNFLHQHGRCTSICAWIRKK